MSGQTKKNQRRRSKQPSWWRDFASAAVKAGLRGQRQWALVRHLESLGCGRYPHRGIFVSRRKLAELLGLDGDVKWDGRNTGRREHRLEELGLLTIRLGGGRLQGCDHKRWRGRANRLYPGPALCPQVLVRQQIEADDAAELPQQQLDTASPAPTPGQQLADQYQRRGRPPGPDPP